MYIEASKIDNGWYITASVGFTLYDDEFKALLNSPEFTVQSLGRDKTTAYSKSKSVVVRCEKGIIRHTSNLGALCQKLLDKFARILSIKVSKDKNVHIFLEIS